MIAKAKAQLFGIAFDNLTMQEASFKIEAFIEKKQPALVATLNAEMAMQSTRDKELAEILHKADLVVPDGAGVVWAARRKGYFVPERVAGFDLAQNILKKAAEKGWRVFLLGASPKVVRLAKEKAEKDFLGIKIVGFHDGYFTQEDDEKIVEMIKLSKADVLLLALGVPKQEKWLFRYKEKLKIPLMMGVGGTFDVMAGVMKRAPLWMQKARLEWLFRLILRPQRIGRMLDLPRFVWRVLKS